MIMNIPKKIVLSFYGFIKHYKRYFIIGAFSVPFLWFFLWWLPQWQVDQFYIPAKELAKTENEYRKTWAQIIGGMAILAGVYLTWRRVRATEEGQITERFTRAIDQLGSEDLAIRLGGIYALERIAKDSEKDQWTIMEVLTAYVRENAKWVEGEEKKEQSPDKKIKPPADIQAILTVIGRREKTHGKGEDKRLDLHGTDLRGASLVDARLQGALLVEAHLEGASLWKARLERANLWDARLQGASLEEAHLEGALLLRACLQGANLESVVGLTKEQIKIERVRIDEKTKLPHYLQELKTEKTS